MELCAGRDLPECHLASAEAGPEASVLPSGEKATALTTAGVGNDFSSSKLVASRSERPPAGGTIPVAESDGRDLPSGEYREGPDGPGQRRGGADFLPALGVVDDQRPVVDARRPGPCRRARGRRSRTVSFAFGRIVTGSAFLPGPRPWFPDYGR